MVVIALSNLISKVMKGFEESAAWRFAADVLWRRVLSTESIPLESISAFEYLRPVLRGAGASVGVAYLSPAHQVALVLQNSRT